MSITPIVGLLVGIAIVFTLGILSARAARSNDEKLREVKRRLEEERLNITGVTPGGAIRKKMHPQSEAPLTGIGMTHGKEQGRPN